MAYNRLIHFKNPKIYIYIYIYIVCYIKSKQVIEIGNRGLWEFEIPTEFHLIECSFVGSGFSTFCMDNFKKIFKDARNTLEERKAFEPKNSLIAWDESKVEYVKRYRSKCREALLFKHVPERRCPVCNELRLESRLWCVVSDKRLKRFECLSDVHRVFTKYLHKVICRSCIRRFDWRLKNET